MPRFTDILTKAARHTPAVLFLIFLCYHHYVFIVLSGYGHIFKISFCLFVLTWSHYVVLVDLDQASLERLRAGINGMYHHIQLNSFPPCGFAISSQEELSPFSDILLRDLLSEITNRIVGNFSLPQITNT